MTEIKKVRLWNGTTKILIVPKESDIQPGDFVTIEKLEINNNTNTNGTTEPQSKTR